MWPAVLMVGVGQAATLPSGTGAAVPVVMFEFVTRQAFGQPFDECLHRCLVEVLLLHRGILGCASMQ